MSSFNRSDINSDYLGYSFDGAVDVAIATLNFHPTSKLNLVTTTSYTDNLTGSLYQALIPGTSGLPPPALHRQVPAQSRTKHRQRAEQELRG